jgi:hypothetical protein
LKGVKPQGVAAATSGDQYALVMTSIHSPAADLYISRRKLKDIERAKCGKEALRTGAEIIVAFRSAKGAFFRG